MSAPSKRLFSGSELGEMRQLALEIASDIVEAAVTLAVGQVVISRENGDDLDHVVCLCCKANLETGNYAHRERCAVATIFRLQPRFADAYLGPLLVSLAEGGSVVEREAEAPERVIEYADPGSCVVCTHDEAARTHRGVFEGGR